MNTYECISDNIIFTYICTWLVETNICICICVCMGRNPYTHKYKKTGIEL